jgi:hypothetical protein
MNGGRYCKTCQKSAANSASGKPQYGDIEDRLIGALLEYRDPKGKLTTCYANVAKKLKLDLGRAQEVAQSFGWEIPQDQLEVKVKKNGRPASKNPKKKGGKKGRPAKVKSTEQLSMDDQIAKLVAEAADDVLSVASSSESTKKVVLLRQRLRQRLRLRRTLLRQRLRQRLRLRRMPLRLRKSKRNCSKLKHFSKRSPMQQLSTML